MKVTPGQNTNRNNIVSETAIYYNGTMETRNTRQNVYEYNDLDLSGQNKLMGLFVWESEIELES